MRDCSSCQLLLLPNPGMYARSLVKPRGRGKAVRDNLVSLTCRQVESQRSTT